VCLTNKIPSKLYPLADDDPDTSYSNGVLVFKWKRKKVKADLGPKIITLKKPTATTTDKK